ncbi:MAG TPA: protein kinase [Bacteroidota bacterium]
MIGQTISHYRILEKLGEGGMGVVYKAEDTKLKRTVAIKFLPKHLSMHGEERERFLQEAQAASALNHPNICTVYEIDEAGDETFMVMELIEGMTLREWTEKKLEKSDGYRKLSLRETVDLALQVAEGLEKAHEKGIIHRDVKAENIMVTDDGRAKIMDFGLAKLRGASKLTKIGSTVGTLAYMSPEQVEGIETDHRTDIFSFGVLLYEMLAGHLPFRAGHEAALLYEIVNTDPPSLLEIRKSVDAELNRIVLKSLEKNRDERYQSMREVAVDLKRFKRDSEGRRVERPSAVEEAERKEPERPRSRVVAVAGISVLALALVAAAVYFLLPSEKKNSLAVLPFVNVSGNPDADYLSDGITESIINSLSRLPDLRVMARSSVFHYKGSNVDPLKAGHELNVDAVLTGRVLQRGDTLIIRSELVNVADGSQIWGEQYAQQISNVLAMQEEIAKQISTRLVPKLTTDEEKLVSKRFTEDPVAYQFYLKGRYYWNKRTEDGFKKAIENFNEAIDRDPTYALAYAGLADTYMLMGNYSLLPGDVARERAKPAALKAVEMDESLAEAHISLGSFYEAEWKRAEAEREYRRGVELNPNYATGLQWLGEFLVGTGRFEEGMKEIERARSVDPLSLIINTSHAYGLYMMGRYDESIKEFEKTLELDRTFLPALTWSALPYAEKGQFEKAVELTKKAVALSEDYADPWLQLSYIYARSGDKEKAVEILKKVESTFKDAYVSPFSMAVAYAGLGDNDKVFHWLGRAAQEHSLLLPQLLYDPTFQHVRSDARYGELLKQIGLEK